MKPDSLDKQIIRLLGEDARQNSKILGERLNLSAATVRRRLKRLIRNNLVNIIGVVEPADFGFPVSVVITLQVFPDKLEPALEWLASQPEIKMVSSTMGRFDIVVFARFRSNDHLSNFITSNLSHMVGLRSSETFICLDVIKGPKVALTEIE